MITFKKILYLISSIYVLQWLTFVVECASSSEATRSDDKSQGASASILGSIYHKSRQLRCVTCYEDKRYGDDRSRYYSSYSARSGDDRGSWHYPSYDRYDDRGYRGSEYDRYGASGTDRYGSDRYGADRYGSDRYGTADLYAGYRDDPYGSRPSYDRYDSRTRQPYERLPAYDRGESRGYGYDNRDRYYGSDRDYYTRDRYYERPRYGAAAAATGSSSAYGSYDRDYYDRYSPRYDYRHYRPWDNKYRSQTGYYYAKPQEDRRYLPEPSYGSPCGIRRPNCPYDPPEEGTRVSSGTIDSGHYNVGISQTNYHANPNTNQNDSSKGSGAAAGWSYMREDEQPARDGSNSGSFPSKSNNNNNRDRDRTSDQQSSGYGALLDRETNLIAVEPIKSNENGNSMQKDNNVDETHKQSDNEQNS